MNTPLVVTTTSTTTTASRAKHTTCCRSCSSSSTHTRAREVQRSPTPDNLSLAEKVAAGFVPPGWQPVAWRARLRYLAAACECDHPDLARQYREWADRVTGGKVTYA